MRRLITFFILSLLSFPCFGSEIQLGVSEPALLQFLGQKNEIKLSPESTSTVNLNGPALIFAESRIPVLLVPIYKNKSKVEIQLLPAQEAIEKISQQQVDILLSQLLPEIADVQSQIRAHQNDRALEKLNALQTRYPQIKFLNFIRASLLFLKGKTDEARNLAKESLLLYPNYVEGQQFLKQLQGEK